MHTPMNHSLHNVSEEDVQPRGMQYLLCDRSDRLYVILLGEINLNQNLSES